MTQNKSKKDKLETLETNQSRVWSCKYGEAATKTQTRELAGCETFLGLGLGIYVWLGARVSVWLGAGIDRTSRL